MCLVNIFYEDTLCTKTCVMILKVKFLEHINLFFNIKLHTAPQTKVLHGEFYCGLTAANPQ